MSTTWTAINVAGLILVGSAVLAGLNWTRVRRIANAIRTSKPGAEEHRQAVLAFGAALTELHVTRAGVMLGPFVKHGWAPERCAQVHAAVNSSVEATEVLIREMASRPRTLRVGPDGVLAWLRTFVQGKSAVRLDKWGAHELCALIESHHDDVPDLDPAFAAAGWRGGLSVDEIHGLWAAGERDLRRFLVLTALTGDGSDNWQSGSVSPVGKLNSVTA